MSLARPETYQPKLNKGWARLPIPLTLKALALKRLLHYLSQVPHPVSEVKLTELRNYVQSNLLPQFFPEMIHLAHFNLVKPVSLINVFYALPPSVYATTLDFLGFYEGTECCKPDNSSNWIFGYLPDICLDKKACVKLVALIKTLDATQIRTIRFWAREGAIQASNLPYTLIRLVNLTSLTIRGDVTNHLLRLIGGSCSNLKILDIGRSSKVTAIGLFNMVICKPVRRRRNDFIPLNDIASRTRRPIAASLTSLTLTIGSIPLSSLQFLAHILTSYLATCLPEAKMLKKGSVVSQGSAGGHNLLHSLGSTTGRTLESLHLNMLWGPDPTEFDNRFQVWIPAEVWIPTRDLLSTTLQAVGECHLDVYQAAEGSILIFAHKRFNTLLYALYKVSPTKGLTDLTFFWDTFSWDISHIAQFTDIVTYAPNLVSLQGRVTGTWGGSRLVLHNLTQIHCWILDDVTIISILKWCPSLQTVDIKNVRSIEPERGAEPPMRLTDAVLPSLFEANPFVWPNLRELLVRPTDLTKVSVLALVGKCPNLLRLGDLECWAVTNQDIREVNKLLFNSRSQCSLVVLSFPPHRNQY